MFFNVDKTSTLPVYAQLAGKIRERILNNEFTKGYRMPPERELAEGAGISRGTVKKAYDILIKENLLDAVQGSGTYVSGKNTGKIVNAKESVARLIDFLYDAGYSIGEIESMLHTGLKDKTASGVRVAAVECNIETIKIIEKQLGYFNVAFEHFHLEDVLSFNKGDEVFEDFKLIFTTPTHFEKVAGILPQAEKAGKITRIAVAADLSTIMEISSLGNIKPGELGIISKSPRFAEIIRHNLRKFEIAVRADDNLLVDSTNPSHFDDFLRNKTCVILPPIYTLNIDDNINNMLMNYYKNGGKLITFNYIIEKGSMLHLEELL